MNQMDFTVLSKLGSGSYGQVYKVRRNSDNQQYAMKKVKIMDLKEKDKKNALNQIRILASIEHPNIVQYRQAFFDNQTNHLCIVMELASMGDLSKVIQERFKKAEGFYQYEIWKYGLQILNGLKYLHEMNIVHRDLKPANIFFGSKEELKIGDLNVSKKLQDGLAHTQTGTPNYASPQIWNNESYSYDCDIWSFGCIMYELCCFKPPFRSKNMEELFKKIQSGGYDRIPKRYSFMLEDTIGMCLKKKDKRANIHQLIQIFEKYSSNSPIIIKKSYSSSALLSTIEFPKDKNDFSAILPSSKYQSSKQLKQPKQSNPQIKRPSSGIKQNILNRYLKVQTPLLLNKRRRLTNKVYFEQKQNPQVRQIRSQKLLPNLPTDKKGSSIEKQQQKQVEKNLSFKQILKSLQDARMIQRKVERSNLQRRHLRLAVKF